jgi:hypothetical protein
MKTIMNVAVLGLVVSAFGVGMGACAAQTDTADEGSQENPQVGEAREELVSCSSNCSGVAGAIPITVSGCTTCSATNTSVTCNGVTTQCTVCTPILDPCYLQCGGTASDGCGNQVACHDKCNLAGDCPCAGGLCSDDFCECNPGPCD